MTTSLHRTTIGVLALTLFAGCGGRPDLHKELATVSSWTATAQLAVEEQRTGATTARYTKQLRDKAAAALEEQRKTLGEAAHTADDRARAKAALDSLALGVRALDEASRR